MFLRSGNQNRPRSQPRAQPRAQPVRRQPPVRGEMDAPAAQPRTEPRRRPVVMAGGEQDTAIGAVVASAVKAALAEALPAMRPDAAVVVGEHR